MDELEVMDYVEGMSTTVDKIVHIPVTSWLHRIVDEEAEFIV